MYLADGRPRAIFEVYPPNLSLASEDRLDASVRQLAIVFNGLPFATQLLFRFVAVDLDAHASAAERVGVTRGPALAAAGRDYAALVRHLSRSRVLLEPHVFVVVGLEDARGALFPSFRHYIGLLLRRRTNRGPHRAEQPAAGSAATEMLDQRAEQVALAFHAIGARPRRLNNIEIAELLYGCWCPERAGQQPLRIARKAA